MSSTAPTQTDGPTSEPLRTRSGLRGLLAMGSVALVAIGAWVGYEALRGPSSPVLAATVIDGRPVLLADLCGMRLDQARLTGEQLTADPSSTPEGDDATGRDLGPLVADPTPEGDGWTRFDLTHAGEQVARTAEPDGTTVHHLHVHLATASRTAEHRSSILLPGAPWPAYPTVLPTGGGDAVDASDLSGC